MIERGRTGIPLDARDVVNALEAEQRVELVVAEPLLREQLDEPAIAVATERAQICEVSFSTCAPTHN